jgi:hypothetical protein
VPDIHKNLRIRRMVLGATDFAAIVVPIDCSEITLTNADSGIIVGIRTDKDDSDTERPIAVSSSITMRSNSMAFRAGDTVAWARGASGAPILILTLVA